MSWWYEAAMRPGARESIVHQAVKTLAEHNPSSIVVQGISGMAVGSIVAHAIGVPLLCVRKKGEDRHGGRDITGQSPGASYVIIDDFIDTGRTVTNIMGHMTTTYLDTDCLGFYAYNATYMGWDHIKTMCRTLQITCLNKEIADDRTDSLRHERDPGRPEQDATGGDTSVPGSHHRSRLEPTFFAGILADADRLLGREGGAEEVEGEVRGDNAEQQPARVADDDPEAQRPVSGRYLAVGDRTSVQTQSRGLSLDLRNLPPFSVKRLDGIWEQAFRGYRGGGDIRDARPTYSI